jgi:hypothetical protein
MVSDIGWVYGGVLYGNREDEEFNVRGSTPSLIAGNVEQRALPQRRSYALINLLPLLLDLRPHQNFPPFFDAATDNPPLSSTNDRKESGFLAPSIPAH